MLMQSKITRAFNLVSTPLQSFEHTNVLLYVNTLLWGLVQWLLANHSGPPLLCDSLVFAQLLPGPAANSSDKINH